MAVQPSLIRRLAPRAALVAASLAALPAPADEVIVMTSGAFTAPFQDRVIQYRGGDISWRDEWREFVAAIKENREPIGNGADGLAAMKIALAAYEAEKQKRVLTIDGAGA